MSYPYGPYWCQWCGRSHGSPAPVDCASPGPRAAAPAAPLEMNLGAARHPTPTPQGGMGQGQSSGEAGTLLTRAAIKGRLRRRRPVADDDTLADLADEHGTLIADERGTLIAGRRETPPPDTEA